MKQKVEFSVPNEVTVVLPEGSCIVLKVGEKYNDKEIKSLITNGREVQCLDISLEDLDGHISLSKHLIISFYGLPFFETYRVCEREIEVEETDKDSQEPVETTKVDNGQAQ